MKLSDIILPVKSLYEKIEVKTGDKVDKLIRRELWPLVKPLEMKLSNGTTVVRKDRDGAVLASMKAKALEIVDKYSGDKKQMHTDVINAAHDYREVLRLMTNVMMYNMGHGVIKENLNLPQPEFSSANGLDVNHWETVYKGTDVEGTLYVSDDSIQIDPAHQDNVGYVTVKFKTLVNKQNGEVTHSHSSFELEPAEASDPHTKQLASQYMAMFKQKYEGYLTGDGEHDLLALLNFRPNEQKITASM